MGEAIKEISEFIGGLKTIGLLEDDSVISSLTREEKRFSLSITIIAAPEITDLIYEEVRLLSRFSVEVRACPTTIDESNSKLEITIREI